MTNPKGKVVHLTTVHPLFDTRIFHKEAKTLARAGYDVTLIAQGEGDIVVDGIRVIGLPKPRNRLARIFGLTWRAFRLALCQQADVCHFHDPELLPVGVLLKLFTRAKVIYDVHEDVPKQILNKEWLPRLTRKPLALLYKFIEQVCFPFIDTIVIAEDSYIENYPGRCNVIAIRNYPIISSMANSKQDSRRDWTEGGGLRVVYVGGVTKLRGAVELVEAMKILLEKGYQDVTLFLVGPITPSELKDELTYLIKQYGLEKMINIPGPVPYEKVFDILARANVGVAILHPDPNYIDSLPTKLFEYMAARLPVVASNFPLWREILEGNNCGICVDPLNPKAIADAIEYLITHPEEARKMGENGRRAVEEKYNWKAEAQKLLMLYEKLLKSTSIGGGFNGFYT